VGYGLFKQNRIDINSSRFQFCTYYDLRNIICVIFAILLRSHCEKMELFENLKKEYVEGMTYNTFEDIEVAVPDLTVWLYNRNAQAALPLGTRIFESIERSPTGLKSLTTFLRAYSERLVSLHARYKSLLENARDTQDIVN
jgi:hypothetical protein